VGFFSSGKQEFNGHGSGGRTAKHANTKTPQTILSMGVRGKARRLAGLMGIARRHENMTEK
jgi:hypothetical protein